MSEKHPLHDKYPELHKSEEVAQAVGYTSRTESRRAELTGEAPVKPSHQPEDKLEDFMGVLERIHIGRDEHVQGRIKDIYHREYVMQPDQVPDSYFDLQRRIAREQGYGDVEIPDHVRQEMAETISRDQERSLDRWIDYLSSEDAAYPMWFKYYVFRNVVKLASFDKDRREFPKRSKSTTGPFAELNAEALAYMAGALSEHYGLSDIAEGAPGVDPAMEELLDQNVNFAKLYQRAIELSAPEHTEASDSRDGQWVKYDQGTDGTILAQSLQGYGTGWCTAGESVADSQLRGGDFYVYYTRDADGVHKVPRVAIRMQEGSVAEVRGIEADQNLEGDLVEIAEAQLDGLSGADQYRQASEDMQQLTQIERLLREDLTALLRPEDVTFLYELDHVIQGFGYARDPRIDEIRALRGERDHPEIRRLVPELLRRQIETSYQAYADVARELGVMPLVQEQLVTLYEHKHREWLARGVYEYVVDTILSEGGSFHVVATPEVETTPEAVVSLAEDFGQTQPFPTYIFDSLYRRGRYRGQELSGETTGAPARFSLIPSRLSRVLGRRPVSQQRLVLARLQAEQPALDLRVPSVLDAVTYWYALRAGGDELNDSDTFDRTYIRHFDLEPQRVDGGPRVPSSHVRRDGGPRLDGSNAEFDHVARLAVG